jgi:transglutaminase-like putative cysteine protease/tetratricopeptide (TPR) repeat protein
MRPSLSSCLSLCLFLLASPFAGAQTPSASPAITSTPASHSIDDFYAKEPYVYELVQTAVRFERDGKGHRDLTLRVRIQSESAVHEFGLLVYSFSSKFESLEVVYARVRKPDGTVIETPASDVQELDSAVSREAPMYTDEREKHIAIKALGVGDILEARLHWTIREPMAPDHFWFDYSYFRAGICLKETLEIDVPRGLAVKLRNSDPQPTIREEGDRLVYSFQSSNLKKFEASKIPEWEKNYHGIAPPDVQLSSFSSWDEVGRWFGALVQPKTAVTAEIRAKSDELTKGRTTDDEKIHALYDFVSARYRYIGVDLGFSRYTPHSAVDVLANRYGDCKDKHTLFAALLQAEGIPAYPVLISSKFRLDASFPSPSLFDHVITAVPRGDSFLILDTTPEVAPFGLLVASLRDRQALVVANPGMARLVTTPADPPFPNFEHFNMDSSLDAKGTLDGKMRLELRGDTELIFRLTYRSTPQNRWQELTQNIVGRMGFGGTVSDVSISQPEDTSQPFSVSCSYHRTDFSDWKNHRITLPFPPVLIASLTEEQKVSKETLPIGELSEVIHEATIKLPPDFSAVIAPNVSRKTEFAEFSTNYIFKDSVLHGTVRLKTLLREIPGDKRHDFSNLTTTINDAENRYILITGKFPDGDTFPANLMGLDFSKPEAMIPPLEKAFAANPDNRMVLFPLSQAYTRTGRAKDAVAILEKSLAETPDDSGSLYFALGQAYLAVPEADKAMANYQKALGDDPKPALLNSIAYSLAEASVHLKEALEYSTRAVASLSEETMDISPESARPSDYALMGQLAADWDTLGWIKFRLGDLPAAVKYIDASWRLVQSSEIGEHLVEVYEGMGQKEKAALICHLANAALGHNPSPENKLREKLTSEMTRLRPFLKASPSGSNSSKHTIPDAYVALTDMRSLNIPLRIKLHGESGRAAFTISLVNGLKVEEVDFLSGSEELRAVIPALTAAKYSLSFPDDVPVRILLKANLNCSVYSKDCLLFISTVTEAASSLVPVPFNVAPQ